MVQLYQSWYSVRSTTVESYTTSTGSCTGPRPAIMILRTGFDADLTFLFRERETQNTKVLTTQRHISSGFSRLPTRRGLLRRPRCAARSWRIQHASRSASLRTHCCDDGVNGSSFLVGTLRRLLKHAVGAQAHRRPNAAPGCITCRALPLRAL